MKRLILSALLLLAASGCQNPEPEFCYQQKVKVVGGFYRGWYGDVRIVEANSCWFRSYYVMLKRGECVRFEVIAESDLDPVEE